MAINLQWYLPQPLMITHFRWFFTTISNACCLSYYAPIKWKSKAQAKLLFFAAPLCSAVLMGTLTRVVANHAPMKVTDFIWKSRHGATSETSGTKKAYHYQWIINSWLLTKPVSSLNSVSSASQQAQVCHLNQSTDSYLSARPVNRLRSASSASQQTHICHLSQSADSDLSARPVSRLRSVSSASQQDQVCQLGLSTGSDMSFRPVNRLKSVSPASQQDQVC